MGEVKELGVYGTNDQWDFDGVVRDVKACDGKLQGVIVVTIGEDKRINWRKCGISNLELLWYLESVKLGLLT